MKKKMVTKNIGFGDQTNPVIGDDLITKLAIKRFKGFENFEIKRLTRVTLLGGHNNVGKTSILEALFMLHDRFNPQMILRQFGFRGVGIITSDPQSMWAPVFNDYNLDKDIEISIVVNGNQEIMRLTYNPRYIASKIHAQNVPPGSMPAQIRTDQKPEPSYSLDISYEKNKKTQTGHLLTGVNGLELRFEKMQMDMRQAVFIGARSPGNPTEDAYRFGQLDILGKQDIIVNFLKIIEPKLKSLSSVTMGEVSLIHGDIGLSRKIPVSYMGDGISRLLTIILAIATSKNGIVLIDECENGIHHSVMPNIWKAIAKAAREYNCQIVCTTHSYECLEAAKNGISGDLAEDFSYIRIDRDENKRVAKCFDHEMLAMALKNNMEVR
jgi:hypothetical protein